MIHPIAYCAFEGAKWLLFGPNVPNIIYYSHIPNIVISVILGLFILFQNRKSLPNKILFWMILAFEAWVFFALVFWATNRSDVVMFAWLMDILVEPLVYIAAFYMLYVLIEKKDISFGMKLLLSLIYLPIPLLLPTPYTLASFDVSTCLANESVYSYYSYFVEILMFVWVIVFAVHRYVKAIDKDLKKEVLYISLGTVLLLFAFGWGNIIGSFSDNWQLGDYGLFGMPIFTFFLAYTIVKFKAFDIKLLGAQALVWGLVALIGSQFFYLNDSPLSVKILTAITLVIASMLGLVLVRSVKREVALREELQKANAGQENLIHIMNHQIKGHLGIAKNVFAELLTGDYGDMPDSAKPVIQKGLDETDSGVRYVTDILRGASAENGTLPYDMHPIDFKGILSEVAAKEKDVAEKKNLSFNLDIDDGAYTIMGDAVQLGEAIKNLLDNSIYYTPSGSIWINLVGGNGKLTLSVKDTGVGVKAEDAPKLFKAGGVGKDSIKVNVKSSGYGLAFVKGVIEAHKGRVWFESAGEGKGSTFFVELPLYKNA